MDKNNKNIFHNTDKIKLSQEEKNKMRENLELFMEYHPVRNPETFRLLIQRESKSYTLSLINRLQPMIAALLIVLLVSGSASLAAENSLPGDLLYPLKVSVNEEIKSFVTFSDEAQANWDARRAERRLEEAEKLAAKGRLNAEAQAELESQFEDHAEAFQKSAEKLEKKQNSKASLEVRSNFEASLKTHEQALTKIAEEEEKASTEAKVEPLLLEVRAALNAETKNKTDESTDIESKSEEKIKIKVDL